MFRLLVDKAIFELNSQVGPGKDFSKAFYLKKIVFWFSISELPDLQKICFFLQVFHVLSSSAERIGEPFGCNKCE